LEARQGKLVLGPLTLVLVAAIPLAATGEASGSLTMNGETVALKYAYATARSGFFEKSAEDAQVLLSDVPRPEAHPPSRR
jgi:hypothetical protein